MNNLSTKNKILTFVSISLIVFIMILISTIYLGEKENLQREKNAVSNEMTSSYNSILQNNEIFYKARLDEIMINPEIFDAFVKKDRKKLYKLIEKRWNILKKENPYLKIMHFHLADGTTFLRVHSPNKYGDEIAKRRPMVAFVHKHNKFVSSFEAGIHLLGYRLIKPIFYKDKYIGAVELGSSPKFILNEMKKLKGISGLVFAKEENIYNKELVNIGKLKIGEFRLDSSTIEDDNIIKNIPKNYSLDKDIIISVNNKTYSGYLFNHTNFNNQISAKTLIVNDITEINEHFYENILKIIIFSLFLYIIFVLTIKYGFEKMLNKIDVTTNELKKNVAFLKSHQLAMDESSIVSKADLTGTITYVNDNFCKVTGFSKEEVIGKPHSIVRHPSNSKEIFEQLWETIKAKKVWKGILLNRGKLNDYWVDISILPILDEKENIVEYIAVRHNITKMIHQQQTLDAAANTDTLTGYGSRYKLTNDIKKSIQPAIALLNIDSFSQINDFYGHEKGDIVLQKLATIIEKTLKDESCTLYHLQGDEFVVFNKEIDKNLFVDKMKKISSSVSAIPIILDDEEIFINLSTAISFENKSNILKTVDMALRIAKKENKNLVVYDDSLSLNNEYENNIKWAKKIKYALESDKIVPVFQPIVNNKTNKWEKYEALVRLKDEEKLISPYFFLDISKKTKHYTQITKVMLDKSFEMFKDKEVEFSVNITIEDILNEEIKEYIYSMLEVYKIGSRVVFEIVESESIENFEEIAVFLEKLKSYGCKIAIDDFGTGYSNFEYLMKVKADYIKIDGSMIKDIDTNIEAQMVVSTIVEFAKKMGMKTIAEFVENESILNKVIELEIDYSQGYHFSEPKRELAQM